MDANWEMRIPQIVGGRMARPGNELHERLKESVLAIIDLTEPMPKSEISRASRRYSAFRILRWVCR